MLGGNNSDGDIETWPLLLAVYFMNRTEHALKGEINYSDWNDLLELQEINALGKSRLRGILIE